MYKVKPNLIGFWLELTVIVYVYRPTVYILYFFQTYASFSPFIYCDTIYIRFYIYIYIAHNIRFAKILEFGRKVFHAT